MGAILLVMILIYTQKGKFNFHFLTEDYNRMMSLLLHFCPHVVKIEYTII